MIIRTGNYCEWTVLFNVGWNLQKRDIVYSAGNRCSHWRFWWCEDLHWLRTNELIDYLYKRGCNRYFLQREIHRVNNITRAEALTPHDTSTLDKTERVPFVITYNLSLRSISSIIRKHLHILISSHRCYTPIVALDVVVPSAIFQLGPNFAISHNTTGPGAHTHAENCLTCKYISDGQTSYKFQSTGETRPITHNIDCNSKNMIQCNRCSKQLIGETKRRLKDRFNEHRRPVDNPSNLSKPTTVSEHLLNKWSLC